MENIFSNSVLQQITVNPQRLQTSTRYRYFLLVIALIILALSRPVSMKKNTEITQPSATALIALDVSKSMHASDIYPSRLAFAKLKLLKLLQKAQSLHVGIVLFAKNVYMLYPVSEDTQALAYMFKNANIQQKFEANTNIFGVLQVAKQMLKSEKIKNIILLSDGGEDVKREGEISYMLKNHLKLYALDCTPKINNSLKKMAQKSGGHYVHYHWGEGDVKSILAAITNASGEITSNTYTIKQYKEFFIYPLSLALFILYFIFFVAWKKKSTRKLFLLFVFMQLNFLSMPMHADVFDFIKLYKAQSAYEQKEYKKAVQYYEKLAPTKERNYNLGNAFYKQHQYLEALKYYKHALGTNKQLDAKIFYNMGNCYVQRGKLELAKSQYHHSLQLHPYKKTKNNLHVIIQELKKRKKLKKIFGKGTAKVCFKNTLEGRNDSKVSSKYTIQLKKLVVSQEQKWIQKIQKQKMPIFLQKIPTQRMSLDAQKPW